MLQLSSFLFATSAAHALTTRHIFYAVLLLFLTSTSVAWHSCSKDLLVEKNRLFFWLDQFAIWSVATLSIYHALRLKSTYRLLFGVLALVTVGLGIYLSVVWWDNKESPTCHSAIHVLAALSMHCIILGSA